MRRPCIAGNWKMFKTRAQAEALATDVRNGATGDVEVVVAPPFTALSTVADVLRGSAVGLAGQNMHAEAEGAFTGEVSPGMLRDAGCTHVILGHPGRRQLLGGTDEGVAKKAQAALRTG